MRLQCTLAQPIGYRTIDLIEISHRHAREGQQRKIAIRAEFRRDRGWLMTTLLLKRDKQLPAAAVSSQRIRSFRGHGVGYRGPLRVTDAGMNVIHTIGHGLNGGELGLHQAFTDTAPVAEISRKAQTWMLPDKLSNQPGIEQAATAMGFETHWSF
mgnify:CR=1 FL=1